MAYPMQDPRHDGEGSVGCGGLGRPGPSALAGESERASGPWLSPGVGVPAAPLQLGQQLGVELAISVALDGLPDSVGHFLEGGSVNLVDDGDPQAVAGEKGQGGHYAEQEAHGEGEVAGGHVRRGKGDAATAAGSLGPGHLVALLGPGGAQAQAAYEDPQHGPVVEDLGEPSRATDNGKPDGHILGDDVGHVDNLDVSLTQRAKDENADGGPGLVPAGPVYVEPFLGGGSVWLALLDPELTPPVAFMGGKRRLASQILRHLGLVPGMGLGHAALPAVLGDASWWGWVWQIILDPETGPQVCSWLRRWQGEDPRALWFRLRDAGAPGDPVERAAGLLWLQARAASGVPVWWEGEGEWHGQGYNYDQRVRDAARAVLVQERGWKSPTCSTRKLFPAAQGNADEVAEGRRERRAPAPSHGLVQWASTQIDEAGQRGIWRKAQGKGFIGGSGSGGPSPGGLTNDQPPPGLAGCGGIVNPASVADRLDMIQHRLVKASGGEARHSVNDGSRQKHGWRRFEPGDIATRLGPLVGGIAQRTPVLVHHMDALALTRLWARQLGPRARVFLDPPYAGATGYEKTCTREDVLEIAQTWAAAGARVVLSEAVGLARELGPGWREICLRADKKPEWITVHGEREAQIEEIQEAHPGLAAAWSRA